MSDGPAQRAEHVEPHGNVPGTSLNRLRAGVLGANDGVVSTSGLVVGVAGATASVSTILTAGVAGLLSGAISMAAGEYVSVSSQRDAEQAMLAQERRELEEEPEAELEELAEHYRGKGIPEPLAREVAEHLTRHDALGTHAETELGITPGELTNPWHAALASFLAFTIGAALPLLAIVLTPGWVRVPVTVGAVVLTLVVTGSVSARLGRASVPRAIVRNVGGGLLAMGVTYGVGTLVGHTLV
ncbi:VIT1/CCC1 family predicted Fe2+/Mn2+ transporter [Halopolyspora algeriensis]|uniref:VIT1/CCC1 family predicted Fe2+/Mn2+ transporter n=1 Tax=Halopolyspora algeriensis TaxID=1500506 RepID=A0A368VZZ6_9ACTN|nr:VIT family protein [Halopolyspora algeriensis]RCW47009.1 VIT1/CCC1 family predicted Fe2+/Mn2+ transporter [Halopolyspora algeriensis]TQM48097.1 VIT1/CCC1 family predicted Fe2+/Mn2+ transporter [Halopolyspora algeriensis]